MENKLTKEEMEDFKNDLDDDFETANIRFCNACGSDDVTFLGYGYICNNCGEDFV